MNHSGRRPRNHSKAIKEELQQLNLHLSQRSAFELNEILQTAACTSAEVAHVLIRVINDISAKRQQTFHPVQQSGTFIFGQNESQLDTPPDSAEDSEMSGTDCSRSTFASRAFTSFGSHGPKHPDINFSDTANARPAKRKHLADRDDNLPGPRINLHKKRRSLELPPEPKRSYRGSDSPIRQKHRCVNCSRLVDGHEWENLHGCIHHPGYLTATDIWSCCQSTSLVRGCIVSKHTEVARKVMEANSTAVKYEQMLT